MTLDDFTRFAGAGILFVGAFVVSPQGARLLGGRVRAHVSRAGAHLSRRIPFFRRPATVLAAGSASAAASTVTARGRVRPRWPDAPTVDNLAEVVHGWLLRVDDELAQLWSSLNRDRVQAKQDLDQARRGLQSAIDDLIMRMTEAERHSAENDSRAIPVLGIGAVMGTVPGEIASLPLWFYWPLHAVAFGLAALAVLGAWQSRHGLEVSKP